MNSNIQAAYEQAAQQTLEEFKPRQTLRAYRGGEVSDLETAYKRGFNGAFGPTDDNPEWARKIAKYEKAQLIAESRCKTRAEEVISSKVQGIGAGKRGVHFGHYLRADPNKALRGAQGYGNCVAWALREATGSEWVADIAFRNEPQEYVTRIGTALSYGSRGHGGQGSYGGVLVKVFHNVGIQLEQPYCDGRYDCTVENDDEWYGNRWGGRGGPPSCMKTEVEGDKLEQFSYVTEESAIQDLLHLGHFGLHGSNYTANRNNRLISGIRRIGGHEQALIGYDDTDEFRGWYEETTGKKLTGAVYINDQSWGAWNTFPDELWPGHLWGPRPQGVWVINARDMMRIVGQWDDLIFVSNVLGFRDEQTPHCSTCSCFVVPEG